MARNQSCFPEPSLSPAGNIKEEWEELRGCSAIRDHLLECMAAGDLYQPGRAVHASAAGREGSAHLEPACHWLCCFCKASFRNNSFELHHLEGAGKSMKYLHEAGHSGERAGTAVRAVGKPGWSWL